MTEHLAALVLARADAHPDAVALRGRTDEGWAQLTYADLAAQVRHVSHGLIATGLHPGDAVAIIADNRPEWLVTELAVVAAAGVVVRLGPATPVEELAVVLRETEARAAFVAGDVLVDSMRRLSGRLPSLRVVVCFDENPSVVPLLDDFVGLSFGNAVDDLGAEVGTHGTFSFDRVLAAPFDIATAAEAARRRDAWSPDDIAFIDYTVGGAGELRGVVHTHRSALTTVKAIAEALQVTEPLHEVTTLPLHHSVQHGSSLIALLSGGSVSCVGDPDDVRDAIRELRPTMLMTSFPVLRRLVDEALERAGDELPLGATLVPWCRRVSVADSARRAEQRGAGSVLDELRLRTARLLVGTRVARELGGPKALFLVAGVGAPPEVMSLLETAGLPAYRCWGPLESGVLATVNAPHAAKDGSVGRPLSCLSLRIDDDGQVLLAGPGLMRGYFGLPAETARVLRDGWLHTGQIGRVDDDGYLHLTSRLDDRIVTESLRYVSPQVVEERLRSMPIIADVVVVGDGRPCLTAIVEADVDLARQVRLAGGDHSLADDEALATDPLVVRAVGDAIRLANASLSPDQCIQGFRLTASPLGRLGGPAAAGFMRRQRVERECAAAIEEMYSSLAIEPSRR